MTDSSPTTPILMTLRVREPAGLARQDEPLRIGVPLPRGRVMALESLSLRDSAGRALPLQARSLMSWSDGSVKWVLVDTRVDCGAGEVLELRLEEGSGASAPGTLAVHEDPAGLRIDTGRAVFVLGQGDATLLRSVTVNGTGQLGPRGLALVFRDGRGRACQPRLDRARIEEQGPLRVVLVADGSIPGTGRKRPLELRARITLHAGSAEAGIELRVRNPQRALHRKGLWDLGDPGSVLIRELALELDPAQAPSRVRWQATPADAPNEQPATVDWTLLQDSSGGETWQSPNHLGADGELTVSFRGWQLREAGVSAPRAEGLRATPLMEVQGPAGAVAASVEQFWQNFPKALRLRAGRLQIALFPEETRAPVELQGGEQKRHRAWLAFGAPGEAAAQIARRHAPLQVTMDPAAVEASQAIHGFAAHRADEDPRYEPYIHTIVEGERSFFAGREVIDEYGWRNFGDVWADHEAVNHKGPGPFVSHYNNQYDVVMALLFQHLRHDDGRWFELAHDLARHVADIDVYHTQDDRAAYNGGLFWHTDHYLPAGLSTHRTYSRMNAKGGGYGGGPSNEHNYTTGLLHHHLLTGDEESAETVVTLADYVIAMDDGARTMFALFDDGPTGDASKTVSADYHGPGRGAGNSINALLDAFTLTGRRRFMAKAEELVQRCIHPDDDIGELGIGEDPEHRWSYLVFLQVLAKFLAMKQELGETDHGFHYARESLRHYARWMLENERPYQEVLHKVELPTETWPAQDVRKACVLEAARVLEADYQLASTWTAAALQYRQRALNDLLGFATAPLARPRVLLANYYLQHAEPAPQASPRVRRFEPRFAFLGQRARLIRGVTSRARVTLHELARQLRGR